MQGQDHDCDPEADPLNASGGLWWLPDIGQHFTHPATAAGAGNGGEEQAELNPGVVSDLLSQRGQRDRNLQWMKR